MPSHPTAEPLQGLGSPRQYDLIAFDWDGTLFDSTAIITRCIQAAVVDVGGARPSDEQAAYVIGLGLMQALAHAAPDVPVERYPELAARYRHHYLAHQNDISLFEGVVAMLDGLKSRRHLLAVATGKAGAAWTRLCRPRSCAVSLMARGPPMRR